MSEVSDEEFIKLWNTPGHAWSIASRLGVDRASVSRRAHRLRQHGHQLENKTSRYKVKLPELDSNVLTIVLAAAAKQYNIIPSQVFGPNRCREVVAVRRVVVVAARELGLSYRQTMLFMRRPDKHHADAVYWYQTATPTQRELGKRLLAETRLGKTRAAQRKDNYEA